MRWTLNFLLPSDNCDLKFHATVYELNSEPFSLLPLRSRLGVVSYGRNETWPELWAGKRCCGYETSPKGRRVGRTKQLCCPVSEIVKRPRMWAINPLNTPRKHVETLSVTNEVFPRGIGPLAWRALAFRGVFRSENSEPFSLLPLRSRLGVVSYGRNETWPSLYSLVCSNLPTHMYTRPEKN